MTGYHSDEYIRFLKSIRPDNVGEYTKLMQRCKTVVMVTVTCPLFWLHLFLSIHIYLLSISLAQQLCPINHLYFMLSSFYWPFILTETFHSLFPYSHVIYLFIKKDYHLFSSFSQCWRRLSSFWWNVRILSTICWRIYW